jgi:hypothetical protein
MRLVFSLAGYDRVSERQVVEFDIPASDVKRAMEYAGVDPHRTPLVDYPLNAAQAKAIARLIGAATDTSNLDFFLETSRDEKALA